MEIWWSINANECNTAAGDQNIDFTLRLMFTVCPVEISAYIFIMCEKTLSQMNVAPWCYKWIGWMDGLDWMDLQAG